MSDERTSVEPCPSPPLPSSPLLAWKPTFIGNWKEWRRLWETTELLEMRHGLLHIGFQTRCEDEQDEIDRLLFYLELADGHSKDHSFQVTDDPKLEVGSSFHGGKRTGLGRLDSYAAMRQVLADKAFRALCASFFNFKKEKEIRFPIEMLANQQVLEKVLWFFRMETGYSSVSLWNVNVRHLLPGSPVNTNNQIALEFVCELCKKVWKFEGFRSGSMNNHEREVRDRFNAVRPALTRILCGLRELDVIVYDFYSFPLDEAVLAELHRLVFEFDLVFPDGDSGRGTVRRKPKTLQEAVFGKSEAAIVYLVLLTQESERVRFDELRKAARLAQQAQENLVRLQTQAPQAQI